MERTSLYSDQFEHARLLDVGDYYKPQPGARKLILEARDGAESGTSVTVYRSKEPNARPGSVCKPARRVLCEQSVSASEVLAEFGVVECAGDIRDWAGEMSWPKIKHNCSLELLNDDILDDGGEGEEEVEIDCYDDVDDYTPPYFLW
jgi:hypothetical protein